MILDLLVIAVLLYSIVSSAMRGFVREAFGAVTILAGLVLAAWSYRGASSLFKDVVRTENLALFFGFSMIFLVTLVVGFVIIWLTTRFMKFAKLQWADRLLGAAFGLICGWMIGSVIFLSLTAFDVQTERVRNSELAPYFLPGSRMMAVIAPYELKAKFLVGYRALERWWQQQQK